MPIQNPIKYANGQHVPFASEDTVPAATLTLAQRLRPGHGIAITADADGGITITNTCCPSDDDAQTAV
jgi:hypothetical protein